MKQLHILILTISIMLSHLSLIASEEKVISTPSSDGVTIFAESNFSDLDDKSPLILLFHQGGSNVRGEYEWITPWLNQQGYRVLAWDLRTGGQRYGQYNRTMVDIPFGIPSGFCDAYADMDAAIEYTKQKGLAEKVILWGSSFSGALVFQAAAKHKGFVDAVMAFSPASGGPMADCKAELWLDKVSAPVLGVSPASELERESVQQQRLDFLANGATYLNVDKGIHGSSLLVDERTGHDMSKTRNDVLQWLRSLD